MKFSDASSPTYVASYPPSSLMDTSISLHLPTKIHVAGTKLNSEGAQHLKSFIARVEAETGKSALALCGYGDGEYAGVPVQSFLEERGIKHEVTTPDAP
jgi:hypothetical protein